MRWRWDGEAAKNMADHGKILFNVKPKYHTVSKKVCRGSDMSPINRKIVFQSTIATWIEFHANINSINFIVENISYQNFKFSFKLSVLYRQIECIEVFLNVILSIIKTTLSNKTIRLTSQVLDQLDYVWTVWRLFMSSARSYTVYHSLTCWSTWSDDVSNGSLRILMEWWQVTPLGNSLPANSEKSTGVFLGIYTNRNLYF